MTKKAWSSSLSLFPYPLTNPRPCTNVQWIMYIIYTVHHIYMSKKIARTIDLQCTRTCRSCILLINKLTAEGLNQPQRLGFLWRQAQKQADFRTQNNELIRGRPELVQHSVYRGEFTSAQECCISYI
jgi:hypothetical protein